MILGFICIQCSQYSPMGIAQFFSTVTMIAFWFTGILLVLYLFHVVYAFNKIPWMKIEFFFCAAATLFLMLTSSLVAARGVGLFTAAAVWSFLHWESLLIKTLRNSVLILITVFRICRHVRLRIWRILEIQTIQYHYNSCHSNDNSDSSLIDQLN